MGLLDDAIREHLELMRRRGADPTEIARAEADALSPPVREVEEPESHAEGADLPAGTEPLPEPEATDDTAVEAELAAGDAALPDEQATEHFDVLGHSEAAEEAAIDESDFDDPSLRSPDAETAAHDLEFDEHDDEEFEEDVVDDAEEVEGEDSEGEIEGQQALPGVEPDDVLEGTPDFLADSPDHDKLWFEQSGPRDFDFDGEDGK